MAPPGFSFRRKSLLPAWIAVLALLLSAPALADIFRWEDESGVVHFTDDLSSVPAKYRGRAKDILKTPPPAGKPGLSTMGDSAPHSPAGAAPYSPGGNGGETVPPPSPGDSPESLAEQLRAKIAAKEQFLQKIDAKRSHVLNPMGNRYVSPEDLELYRKYSAELPGDRERLREIESRLPPGVN